MEINFPEELIELILKTLNQREEPLTVEKILKDLPPPFKTSPEQMRKILEEQVRKEVLHKWAPYRRKNRYWVLPLETVAQEKLLKILSEKPLTRLELITSLKKDLWSCSENKTKDLVRQGLKKWSQAKRIFEHPPDGKQRSTKFFISPPDSTRYLNKVKREVETVCKKLQKSDVSPEQIFQALGKMLGIVLPSTVEKKPVLDPRKIILDKIREIEPRAEQEVLVQISQLRGALNLPKDSFDNAINDLIFKGFLMPHHHVHPQELSPEELEELVREEDGSLIIGIVLRKQK